MEYSQIKYCTWYFMWWWFSIRLRQLEQCTVDFRIFYFGSQNFEDLLISFMESSGNFGIFPILTAFIRMHFIYFININSTKSMDFIWFYKVFKSQIYGHSFSIVLVISSSQSFVKTYSYYFIEGIHHSIHAHLNSFRHLVKRLTNGMYSIFITFNFVLYLYENLTKSLHRFNGKTIQRVWVSGQFIL